jgi:hypothetical protein
MAGGNVTQIDTAYLDKLKAQVDDLRTVARSPGNYYIPNFMNAGSFGNLLSDSTWVAMENQAKQLWLKQIEDTDYDGFAEPTAASRRGQYRQGTH